MRKRKWEMAIERQRRVAALWRGGWYRFARVLASPNFSPRPETATVDLLVLHSISLPPREYGTGHVQAFFLNQLEPRTHPYFESIASLEVSAHFFVTRLGQLWQFVSCDSKAWHAGQSAFRGRTQCNDFSIGIELEGLEGDSFETAQYETLAALCSAIAAQYPIRHVTGHEHIAPGRKFDPGAGFDWTVFSQALGVTASVWPSST
jgi:N-acetyl-anhydromuramoyl-L-alanine amidase